MFKQAIWITALIGRSVCQGIIEAVEAQRPHVDEPLDDCGLFWPPPQDEPPLVMLEREFAIANRMRADDE